jgi:hypothetical protein
MLFIAPIFDRYAPAEDVRLEAEPKAASVLAACWIIVDLLAADP